jgi:hypothetical protein
MHPVHAIESALAIRPAAIGDLLAQLPTNEVTAVSTRDNAAAQEAVSSFHRVLNIEQGTGAAPFQDMQGWNIFWESGWWVLIGHAYPASGGNRGELARDCPLLLLNRQNREVLYGPELPMLAKTCLGNSLTYQAIRALQD